MQKVPERDPKALSKPDVKGSNPFRPITIPPSESRISFAQGDPPVKTKRGSHGRVWSIGLNRGFSKEQLRLFLDHCDEERFQIVYTLMAFFGFRVGEVVRLRLEDINLEKKEICMWNIKRKTLTRKEIHPLAFGPLQEYIDKHRERITEHGGWIAYSNNRGNKAGHLCENEVRKKFRSICERAGLTEVYAEIKSSDGQKGDTRKLRRLSTHSLRHFYIGWVYQQTKDPILTQKAARHDSLQSTQSYLDCVNDRVDSEVKRAFEGLW